MHKKTDKIRNKIAEQSEFVKRKRRGGRGET